MVKREHLCIGQARVPEHKVTHFAFETRICVGGIVAAGMTETRAHEESITMDLFGKPSAPYVEIGHTRTVDKNMQRSGRFMHESYVGPLLDGNVAFAMGTRAMS